MILKFTFCIGLCPFEGTETYMVIEMLLAQQSMEKKRRDRHKLEHDNPTVPTQLVPAGAL